MPKCTINGKEVDVKEGSTIMEAFYKSGERIAHYCYHPGLSVAGVCRLCICDIEGNPRPQIACNTVVTEGMKISNKSERIRDGVKWVLDFHLINHPLDCPICDQAGECGLQDQYMEYGKYDPEMAEKKVKKHKVVSLGPTVVLDSERCILCSRCVRFTEEVSKTSELGIFNRGDRSEIGVVEGKKLDNKYSLNTVDICPVGALTSKDFRFKQRVWYLKDGNSVCNGCSTGCNIKVYFNKEGIFRVKPNYNKDINGHWMCDEGRDLYKFVNKDHRYSEGFLQEKDSVSTMTPEQSALLLKDWLQKFSADKISVVITGQYTNEEYQDFFELLKQKNIKKVYHWFNHQNDGDHFDGLLLRGDKNPNTKGLLTELNKASFQSQWTQLETEISKGSIDLVLVLGPENQLGYRDLSEKAELFKKVKNLAWYSSAKCSVIEKHNNLLVIPAKSYIEKNGSFMNHSGIVQKFQRITTVLPDTLGVSDLCKIVSGKNLSPSPQVSTAQGTSSSATQQATDPLSTLLVEADRPADRVKLEHRKKNEFVFKRGSL